MINCDMIDFMTGMQTYGNRHYVRIENYEDAARELLRQILSDKEPVAASFSVDFGTSVYEIKIQKQKKEKENEKK